MSKIAFDIAVVQIIDIISSYIILHPDGENAFKKNS